MLNPKSLSALSVFSCHWFVAGCNGNICKDGVTDDLTSGLRGQGCALNGTCPRSRAIVLDPGPNPMIRAADSLTATCTGPDQSQIVSSESADLLRFTN